MSGVSIAPGERILWVWIASRIQAAASSAPRPGSAMSGALAVDETAAVRKHHRADELDQPGIDREREQQRIFDDAGLLDLDDACTTSSQVAGGLSMPARCMMSVLHTNDMWSP